MVSKISKLPDHNSVSLPAPSCSSVPLDAVDAASVHEWHDFHKHNSLLIWEFGKGGDLSTNGEQGHLRVLSAEEGRQGYAK